MDELTVCAEILPDHAAEDARTAAAKDLVRHIKSMIGISVKIKVMDPGGIARSEGKAKRVIDLRGL